VFQQVVPVVVSDLFSLYSQVDRCGIDHQSLRQMVGRGSQHVDSLAGHSKVLDRVALEGSAGAGKGVVVDEETRHDHQH
jgi:hypothetical protein